MVCVSSCQPKESYYRFDAFKTSVRRFGCEPAILGWHQHWGGLVTKPRLMREFLRKGHQEGDIIIWADAWDIVFAAHPDEVAEKYLADWPPYCPIVFNAERNCFPRGDLAPDFDTLADLQEVKTPWKYLNSGFMVGKPQDILTLLESMNLDEIPDDHQLPDRSWFNPNDQEHFTLAFLKQPVPMALDYRTELCMACHGSEPKDFDFSGDKIRNLITDTTPMAFHFNGSGKQCPMPQVLEKLGL